MGLVSRPPAGCRARPCFCDAAEGKPGVERKIGPMKEGGSGGVSLQLAALACGRVWRKKEVVPPRLPVLLQSSQALPQAHRCPRKAQTAPKRELDTRQVGWPSPED